MAIENWEPTPAERETIREALNIASARAWSYAELATIRRLRDILADPTGDMHVWYDAPVRVGSTATTDRGIFRHKPTGGIFLIRMEHGGEANGDVTLLSGSIGPFRDSIDPLMLLDFKGSYRDDPAHLEWLEEESENFVRLDLVVP